VIWVNQKQFYRSTAWKKARQAFIDFRMAIDGGLCQVCGEELGKIVHHTIWLDDENCNDPDISLNPKRFKYECQNCHNKERDPRKITRGRCLYGPDGEIIRNTEY
jgi:5-methylcytosine-specific restriction endonuclease McrA